MPKVPKREPTETRSARLTESGCKALDAEAEALGVLKSDAQRAILVEGLRARGHKVRDARADRVLSEDE